MLNTYFGGIMEGRLKRLPFIGYIVLLHVLFVVLVLAGVASMGVAENLVGGDLTQTRQVLAEKFGLPTMILVGIVVAAVFFATLNLEAKRIRDMGLPGWWSLLAIWIISALLIALLAGLVNPELGNYISSVISIIGFLALVLIPSDTFTMSDG